MDFLRNLDKRKLSTIKNLKLIEENQNNIFIEYISNYNIQEEYYKLWESMA